MGRHPGAQQRADDRAGRRADHDLGLARVPAQIVGKRGERPCVVGQPEHPATAENQSNAHGHCPSPAARPTNTTGAPSTAVARLAAPLDVDPGPRGGHPYCGGAGDERCVACRLDDDGVLQAGQQRIRTGEIGGLVGENSPHRHRSAAEDGVHLGRGQQARVEVGGAGHRRRRAGCRVGGVSGDVAPQRREQACLVSSGRADKFELDESVPRSSTKAMYVSEGAIGMRPMSIAVGCLPLRRRVVVDVELPAEDEAG